LDLDELISMRRSELGELRKVNQHRVTSGSQSTHASPGNAEINPSLSRNEKSGANAFDTMLKQLSGEKERVAKLMDQLRLMERERDTYAERVKEVSASC
jgi:hypothetical protein